MESRREYAFRSLYGALYDSFRAEASGWLVVVWVRRLLLIVLSVALTAQPTAQYMSYAMLHIAVACLQLYFQPYATAELNKVEQVSILVHIVIAVVLLGYPDPSAYTVQRVVLSLTIAPLGSYFLYRQAQRAVLRARHLKALTPTSPRVLKRKAELSVKLLEAEDGGL